jgi:hypothetical protein
MCLTKLTRYYCGFYKLPNLYRIRQITPVLSVATT